MIFKPELAALVVAGEKTVTRRLCSDNPRSPWWRERCTYQPGKVFTVNPGRGVTRIGEARVTSCRRMPLGRLSFSEARKEGFSDPRQFMAAFAGINGEYDPELMVWRVEFVAL
jgi:hypothetical protein